MIDLHSHIIFDVDDGPSTLEESIGLIGESYRQGVRTIVATSHRRKGMFETPEEVIRHHYGLVKEAAESQFSGLELLYGGELYYTTSLIQKLESKQVPTYNNSRYILLEFSGSTPWKEIHRAVTRVLMLGLIPVVAHIERYNALEFHQERVQELRNMGCYTQVNSLHLLKPKLFGDKEKQYKKRGRFFLEHDLIDCIASDMHNLTKRPPYMAQAYQVVLKQKGSTIANDLFYHTPKTIIAQ
ncbi:CpsB/CapC family capsule biosynthesis tyrosine phosphatase [Streptococcus halotolerans]|uniref:CpsB/CapC family capsule biosynthesis tyrosine phosphatase n=1 Tax=Streptococcus halotolerans TaxID=1814128 RepID=UPI000786F842|nr:CpsB/CapC family capsule biosynthesis tyrosine phosphatase [Streptococcus halotolerans]